MRIVQNVKSAFSPNVQIKFAPFSKNVKITFSEFHQFDDRKGNLDIVDEITSHVFKSKAFL